MFHSRRRPLGRLFYWIVVAILAWNNPFAATSPAPGPTLTTITDTVYRADGTPAQGNLVITWPAFVTATGTAVAAGNANVTLGANGALSVALSPNAGASPAACITPWCFSWGPVKYERNIGWCRQLLPPIYTIEFANDLAVPLALQWESGSTTVRLQDLPPRLTTGQVGAYYVADLKGAQITQVTSTTGQVDAGVAPGSGYGIEVRAHNFGWGQANDRNLLGRFGTQTFSLPRLAKVQTYFLRIYDSSSPPHYSRYSAALHIDYPR